MKKKFIAFIIILVAVIILIVFNFSTEMLNNVENKEENSIEIQPEEEVSDTQSTQTSINLYFLDNSSDILVKEERNIDAKNLIDNPYKYILQLLMNGPEDEKFSNAIPKDTKINKVELKKGVLYVDLSKEFLNSSGTNSIYAIVKTMSEFNEVESVKFLIDGQENENLKEAFVSKD